MTRQESYKDRMKKLGFKSIQILVHDDDEDQLKEYARATIRKDKRVNIRISERDLRELKRLALREGLPYQTLISSILHKFVNGFPITSK